MLTPLIILLLAFLIGSLPVIPMVAKFYFGINLQHHGSGHESHRNVYRVLGAGPAVVTGLMDVSKGLMAVSLSFLPLVSAPWLSGPGIPVWQLLLGTAALCGNLFPRGSSWTGGRTFYPFLGALAIVSLPVSLLTAGIALLVRIVSRQPSAGYLSGLMVIAFWMLVIGFRKFDLAYVGLLWSAMALLLGTTLIFWGKWISIDTEEGLSWWFHRRDDRFHRPWKF